MAPQYAVKSLNKGSGSKRFVFKTFAQRVEEVDVDVFRSLAPLKLEPSDGSSFFHENLLRWRELNAAADFTAVYMELLPLAQTMPQLLLHKDKIVKSLLSRLRLSALLSMEPILSLIALLSRDLRDEFLPYMSQFLEACHDLLRTGGDQEPDLLEHMFVSISYVIKYLLKVLGKDILFFLRVTKSLRYYHRVFVRDFIAESVAYLLRKAPPKQLIKGIRRLFAEVEANPCEARQSSCSTLLFYALMGPASGLHSQSQSLLQCLLDKSILSGVQKMRNAGEKVVVQVLSKTFLMLCENVKRENLGALWGSLVQHLSAELLRNSRPASQLLTEYEIVGRDTVESQRLERPPDEEHVSGSGSIGCGEEVPHSLQDNTWSDSFGLGPPSKVQEANELHINGSHEQKDRMHVVHLLSLVTNILEFRRGSAVIDYEPLFSLVPGLLQQENLAAKQSEVVCSFEGPLAPLRLFRDSAFELSSEVARFLLALVRSHAKIAGASGGPAIIATVAPTWDTFFDCRQVNRVVPFIRGVMEQDVALLRIFAPEITRCMDVLIEDYPVDILPLVLDLSQKLGSLAHLLSVVGGKRLKPYIVKLIRESTKQFERDCIRKEDYEKLSYLESLARDPGVVWIALKCLPRIIGDGEKEEKLLLWKHVLALEQSFCTRDGYEDVNENDDDEMVRECLLATALSSYAKVSAKEDQKSVAGLVNEYVKLALAHRRSSHVLHAVAEFLDSSPTKLLPKVASASLRSVLDELTSNLSVPDKRLRTATLRILSFCELQEVRELYDESPSKRQKGNSGVVNGQERVVSCEVFQQIMAVESSQITHENFRQSSLMISSVRILASANTLPDYYVVPLVHALIGLLHNRFSFLWDSVVEAIAGMLEAHGNAVGQVLLSELGTTQRKFLYEAITDKNVEATEVPEGPSKDLWDRFDSYVNENIESTQFGTLLLLHLRVLQRVSKYSEARSRQLIPLFLEFVGHFDTPEECQEAVTCAGKDWRAALKEWLKLLTEMRNARSFFKSATVKEVLLNRFLSDNDPAIQLVTLECILNWKDSYLVSYEEHLKNLISSKTLREELTTWDISKETHSVDNESREPLLRVVLLILFPKMMRRAVKSSGKLAVGRNVILAFLARLESRELSSLFIRLMEPLEGVFTDSPPTGNLHGSEAPWKASIREGAGPQFIELVTETSVAALPHKRKLGFLHMVADSLEIFNKTQLTPYLFALMGLVFRLLETCAAIPTEAGFPCVGSGALQGEESLPECEDHHVTRAASPTEEGTESRVSIIDNDLALMDDVHGATKAASLLEEGGDLTFLRPDEGILEPVVQSSDVLPLTEEPSSTMVEQQGDDKPIEDVETPVRKMSGGVREIKALCFRIFATVMRKFEDVDFPSVYWDIFFSAIKQSVGRFAAENSFTDGPSALMLCILAMSQRIDLAPMLGRDPALVPNVMSILAVKGASTQVVSSVLTFIENILELCDQIEDDVQLDAVKGVLLPHVEFLLSSFGVSLSFGRETATERRSLKRELKILTRVGKYLVDSNVAEKLQGVLLPMLRVKKRMQRELWLEVLHLLRVIGPNLQRSAVVKCLPVFAPLLASASNHDVREAVSETLMAFAEVDESLRNLAELIADLNSMSTATIDEFDYRRRLLAYDQLTASHLLSLKRGEALLILSQLTHDMHSEDMSIRHRASDSLQKYIQLSASLPDGAEEFHQHKSKGREPDSVLQPNNGPTPPSLKDEPSAEVAAKDLKHLVPNFLMAHVRNAMGLDSQVVRREWVLLLREMAACGGSFKEYQCLISNDVEADFFNNIVHLQIHRRIKAMAKFNVICSRSHFSQGALARIFVPLFMNSLFEARGDKEGNLVTAAVGAIACIAGQLPWEPFLGLLMRAFRLLAAKPDHQKPLLRVVCAIVDAFHFFTRATENGDEHGIASGRDAIGERADGNSLSDVDGTHGNSAKDRNIDAQVPAEILHVLQRRVLPEIRKLMVSKTGIVSTPVALTLVKILVLMPASIVEVELPQIVQTVVNSLKSRSQAVRDEGRAALVGIAETLGANYLYFIVDAMQASLTKGFELHVLGYTLNSVLIRLAPRLMVGDIDYCLEQLLELLENDIMGEVAKEKDVEAIAGKMREAKRTRSFESIKLLAQTVTFRTQAMALLGPVRRNLPNSLAPKVKPKLENMLQHIAMGIVHNKSVTQPDLLVFVHAMVEDGVNEEKALAQLAADRKQRRINKMDSVCAPELDNGHATRAPIPHFHLITGYALQLLHNYMKRVKVGQDEEILAMLEPLVGLLRECLRSKDDAVLVYALKNLGFLLLQRLPAVDLHGNEISALVFSISQRYATAENAILQACVNVLIVLIRQCNSLRLSEDELRSLLQLPIFADLEGCSWIGLALLKAIVSRKLLVPELYDMMSRVADLMVTSYATPVRKVCSQILLQFLLDYPLGEKRLQQHLDFFIKNVGYAESTGREAALEMLHTIILKFPQDFVEEHMDSMFFPLVMRLVNEESNHIRELIGKFLKVLMSHVRSPLLQRMVDVCASWYKGADQRLQRTGAQVLGFLIEAMGTRFGRQAQDLLPQCIQILDRVNFAHEARDTCESENPALWQDAYFSLLMMEKLLQQFPKMTLLPDLTKFWTLVSSLLLHEHIWVQKVCGRMLTLYFTASGLPDTQRLRLAASGKDDVFLFHPSWILFIVASFCQQLDSTQMDDSMGEQLLKMLEIISGLLPLLPRAASANADEKLLFLGCDDVETQMRVARALQMLGGKARSLNQATTIISEGGKADAAVDLETEPQHASSSTDGGGQLSALSLVFRKLQSTALRVHPIQTKVVLRWYAAMAHRLGAEVIEQYLQSSLNVLIKITEGTASKIVPEDIKTLGDEVLTEIRELLGATKFVSIYNGVKEKEKQKREKRKQVEKITVLVDPERSAKRKLKLSGKRKAQKKRKVVHQKIQMGL